MGLLLMQLATVVLLAGASLGVLLVALEVVGDVVRGAWSLATGRTFGDDGDDADGDD